MLRIRFFLCCVLFGGLTARAQIVNENLYHKQLAFQKVDSLVTSDIYLLSDSLNQPQFYASHLATAVCADDLCRPVNINIYWDLLGNFLSYQTPVSDPLTKFDHILLTPEDHKKLRKILADTNSLLRDYAPEDMIDKRVVVRSSTTDATTGATIKSFEDDIVQGAVYTVHTLWHFVNGEIPKKILQQTEKAIDERLTRQLLTSGNAAYQSYILENLPTAQLAKFKIEIRELILSDNTYVPHYAIEKLVPETWSNPEQQNWIMERFMKMTYSVQNALLEKFSQKQLNANALSLLIAIAPIMQRNQLAKTFTILENNIKPSNKISIDKLTILQTSKTEELAALATQLLKRLKP